MLALHPNLSKRHQLPLQYPSALPTPPSSQLCFDTLSQAPSPSTQDLLYHYLETQSQSFAAPILLDSTLHADSDPYMNAAYDLNNPTIRIQQSTPIPQLPSADYSQSPMLPTTNNWSSFADNGHMDAKSHQRAASSSSIGSNGSQFHSAAQAGYPYLARSENSPSSSVQKVESYGADEASRGFSNHLPTPTHTPTQESFLNPHYNYTSQAPSLDSTMAAHLSMKQALLDSHGADDDVPGFGHSARHSVSSYGHDSPATPHTAHEDFEDKFKVPPSDMRHSMPKLERTMTDAALDELYNPSMLAQMPQSASQTKSNASLLSPYRNVVSERLQAAQNARSQSPASSISRGVSPFRQGSPYAGASNSFSSPHVRVGTAAQAREVQKAEADAYAFKQNLPQSEDAQPKTISPKDALLDYHETDEDSKVPLFPDGGSSEYENQYSGGENYRGATAQSNFDTSSEHNYRGDNWTSPRFLANYSTTAPQQSQSSFAFVPPSIGGNMHGLPYTSQYRSASSNMASASDPTPEFPAHLTSMESSCSEAGPEASSQQSEKQQLQKPASSTADTGTYTCTYHGCTLRFETPQKLQKHKREGHRQTANPSPMGTTMTSAALLERNSQAGPHKCERINPTTGKPCNTIFSRPYDLTRHEDTIHNARKQKVRCALCVEEKTFSRNDALTRHMRVVHPEVDFPGKHRRRGGNHD